MDNISKEAFDLNINPDIVNFIITKAREFQAKEGVSIPESLPDTEYEYDIFQVLANHKDDLTFQEVKQVIEDLEPDQQVDLLALLYVGREDFSASEWQLARKEAQNNLAPRLTEYLFSKPQIANYLEAGLEVLSQAYESNN